MKGLFNKLMHTYLASKHRKMQEVLLKPHETQERLFKDLMRRAKDTEYGRTFSFRHIRSGRQFGRQVPVTDYESLKPCIERMMLGEADVLWPGQVHWFAKSSGTTSARSKFIPVSHENLKGCHLKSGWDALALLHSFMSDASVFYRKNLVMGGSLKPFEENPDATYGDVSAIMMQHMPAVGHPFFTPDFETAMLDDWDEKMARMTKICSTEDVGLVGGVPTWTIVLFKHMLEYTGKDHILEVWPHLQAYTHGGVGFAPYRDTFERFIPKADFVYQQVYNASEGFFAAQDLRGSDDMLLFLANGIYYEFLPESEWNASEPLSITLEDVEVGVQYAIVISTNSGLWRYTPGDTIEFTSTSPHRIRVTGRTQQFINAFGEEVMIANAEKALSRACTKHAAQVADYTVAPVYLDDHSKGCHEWVIEFLHAPADPAEFASNLDAHLQSVNSDYEAKRSGDLALQQLKLQIVPQGTFARWLASKGKLGGQNKVPRLSNDRAYIDDILKSASRHAGQ